MSINEGYKNLSLERQGEIFILTLQKPPENRLNSWFCQEIIRALNDVRRALGPESEGALIVRGSDTKFFCTVRLFSLRADIDDVAADHQIGTGLT